MNAAGNLKTRGAVFTVLLSFFLAKKQKLLVVIFQFCNISSSAYFKDRLMHVYYIPEADYLLLIAVPGSRCTNHEASYIIDDLVRCLLFSHQTLYRYVFKLLHLMAND